ncbi:MAG: DUF3089 domain-containing protein [Myxococcota bacterium]
MLLFATLLACGTSCEVSGPLDYSAAGQWICTPDAPGACPDSLPIRIVGEEGTLTDSTLEAAEDPPVACFAVYPTLDLRLGSGLDLDTEARARPERWARFQAGPLRQVCDLYVPVYRQVTIGTYGGRATDKKDQCLDAAYGDALAAFEAFLLREPDAGIVLYGHSQGGQHVSRLIRERIETDPAVLDRLVAAYPLGWPVGTDLGSEVGGSFETVPVCTSGEQVGCVVAYRSLLDGGNPLDTGRFSEGERVVCSNPASPDAPRATATLAAFTMAADDRLLRTPEGTPSDALVVYEQGFEATCVGEGTDGGLRTRWVRSDPAPFDLEAPSVNGGTGAHILDVSFGLSDIVDDIRRRSDVFVRR